MLLGLAWGCASSASDEQHSGASGSGGASDASNQSDGFLKLDGDLSDAGPQLLNPLCGVVGSAQTDGGVTCTQDGGDKDCPPATPHCDKLTLRCVGCVPDDREACAGYQPPSTGQAGEGGQAGQSGVTPDGGAGTGGVSGGGVSGGGVSGGGVSGGGVSGGGVSGGGVSGGGVGSGGVSGGGAAGEAGAPSEAGAAGEGGMSTTDAGVGGSPLFGCQVTPSALDGMPVAACAPSGRGGVDAPCNNSGDCQAHLACVASVSGGSSASGIPLCRPYCCEGDAVCNSGMYCAERALRDDRVVSTGPDAGPPAQVPVCVPGDDCDLSTPYPCPPGVQCVCKGATACMVVRSGTTACVVPGHGQELEPCPCAFGYVCSADANVCLRLCLVGGEQTCGQGLCQSVAGLPQAWGVCIGDTKPG